MQHSRIVMDWAKPRGYSKGVINRAGDILISDTLDTAQLDAAFEILENWRAIHSYPMHVFKKRLLEKAKLVDSRALVVQRLKRVPAILAKLNRSYDGKPPTMKLSQMQDLGGCRAVLDTVSMVNQLHDKYYIRGDIKHKLVGTKNYILEPKESGYRGIHLIYKYRSDKNKAEYNDLLVELQLRTRLQHIWATAIETVDLFTRQAIKSSQGDEDWHTFFRLVSSAFARQEGCPTVAGTPENERDLYLAIKQLESKLKVLAVMNGWTNAVQVFEQVNDRKMKFTYFLLELNMMNEQLNITAYTKEEEHKAIERYSEMEKRNKDKKEYDVVLVGADTSHDLRKAYPNYFVDSKEFIQQVKQIVGKY